PRAAARSSAVATPRVSRNQALNFGESFELYAERLPDRNCASAPGQAGYSVKSELTDSSLEMRVMVSASSCAHDRARMRLQARASAESGMVSVTTISSSSDSAMRATAPPDSTGCVQ